MVTFVSEAGKAEIRFLLCDDVGVIGVYGYCVDERVRVKDDTSRVLLFNIHLEDNN